MESLVIYPKECRKSIKRIVSESGMSVETAYAMMLLTAALMDLNPEDSGVVDIVLSDCGIFPEQSA